MLCKITSEYVKIKTKAFLHWVILLHLVTVVVARFWEFYWKYAKFLIYPDFTYFPKRILKRKLYAKKDVYTCFDLRKWKYLDCRLQPNPEETRCLFSNGFHKAKLREKLKCRINTSYLHFLLGSFYNSMELVYAPLPWNCDS